MSLSNCRLLPTGQSVIELANCQLLPTGQSVIELVEAPVAEPVEASVAELANCRLLPTGQSVIELVEAPVASNKAICDLSCRSQPIDTPIADCPARKALCGCGQGTGMAAPCWIL